MSSVESIARLVRPDDTQVFLLSCPIHLPLSFAAHTWFVVNRFGALARWEMIFWDVDFPTRWGNIYRDYSPPFVGIEVFPFTHAHRWPASLLGLLTGAAAYHAARVIEQTPSRFPYRNGYRLFGPNSNTYTQWIIDRVPAFTVKLPLNAFGKYYRDISAR
jgi:hypothetical protein